MSEESAAALTLSAPRPFSRGRGRWCSIRCRVLLLVVSITMVAIGCGNQSSRNLPHHQGPLSGGWSWNRGEFGYWPLPPEAPHACSTSSLLPEKLQKPNGLHLLSISVDLPPDAPPSELSRGDLQLFSIGHDAPIEFFAREPATVGIVVDTSGSMDAKLAQAGAAITQFVTLIEPRDDIFLYAFNSKPYLLQPLTFDHQLVLQRVSLLHAEGESSIYDALIHGIETLQRGCHRKKALFLITDGMDNSSFHSKQKVMAAAHKLNSPILSIGIGNANYQGPLNLMVMGLGRQDDYVDTRTLSELAQQTGGQIYLLRTVGNGDQLKKDAAEIAGAIGNRYTLGFVANKPNINSFRLEVRNHPGAIIKVEGASISIVNVADTARSK